MVEAQDIFVEETKEEMFIHGTQCKVLHINSIYWMKLMETNIGSTGSFTPPTLDIVCSYVFWDINDKILILSEDIFLL